MNTLSTTGLRIDNSCFGSAMLLTRVSAYKEYRDGTPLDGIAGYKYIVVMPSRGYEVLEVKIPGDKKLDVSFGENLPVTFDKLQVRPYMDYKRNSLGFTAQADGIHKADGKR